MKSAQAVNTLAIHDGSVSTEFTLYVCQGTKWEIGFICAGGMKGRDLETQSRNQEIACVLSEQEKKWTKGTVEDEEERVEN
jgi:hypothetical protein